MKLLYKILIISISLVLASSCVTSYFFDEVEDLDNSKIHCSFNSFQIFT